MAQRGNQGNKLHFILVRGGGGENEVIFADAGSMPISAAVLRAGGGGGSAVKNTGNRTGPRRERLIGLKLSSEARRECGHVMIKR